MASGRWDFQNCLQINLRVTLPWSLYRHCTLIGISNVILIQCWRPEQHESQQQKKKNKSGSNETWNPEFSKTSVSLFWAFSQSVICIQHFISARKFSSFCPSPSSTLYHLGNTLPGRKKIWISSEREQGIYQVHALPLCWGENSCAEAYLWSFKDLIFCTEGLFSSLAPNCFGR